jgi:hypothetical protein
MNELGDKLVIAVGKPQVPFGGTHTLWVRVFGGFIHGLVGYVKGMVGKGVGR